MLGLLQKKFFCLVDRPRITKKVVEDVIPNDNVNKIKIKND